MKNHLISIKKHFSLFFVLFLGFVGFSVVLPIFSVMVFDESFMQGAVTVQRRNLFLGILIALFPLGQTIGCPLFGKLSDSYGRKFILLLSFALVIPCYILTAVALVYHNFPLLFISRFFTGLFEGRIIIAQAALADAAEEAHEKISNFGWVTFFINAGFLIGPLLGGFLSDSKIVPWFNYATPFWFIAILTILTFFFVLKNYKEVNEAKHHKPFKWDKTLIPLAGIFSHVRLRSLFVGNGLVYVGMFLFISFFPAFLIKRFSFDSLKIGLAQGYISLPVLFAPLIYSQASRYFSHKKILILSSFLFGCSVILVILTFTPIYFIGSLIPLSLSMALVFTYSTLLVIDKAEKQAQGEALGLNESLIVFAEMLAAFLGGFLGGFSKFFPFILGILFCWLAVIWFWYKKNHSKNVSSTSL